MRFADLHLLAWLWGLVPAALVMVYGIRARKQILARFVHPDLHGTMVPGASPQRRWVRMGLVLGGLGLAILALAGPQAGFRWEKTRSRGVDLMIALDCSRSMLATDVDPTRLARAKREIVDLTRLMQGDRAGLVAFSGEAALQCPLTTDYQAFHLFLEVLAPDYLPVGGTSLARALEACLKGFDPKADTDKAIVLITDGEETQDLGRADLDQVVQTLVKEKIRVFAVGVGDPAGAPIPDAGGGFKRDAQGEIILSQVDEKGLGRLAATTGGRYVRSVAGDMDLDLIYSKEILKTMERKTLEQGKKKVWENRFQWLLFPALLLFLAELFLGSRSRSDRIRPDRTGAARGLICLALGLGVLSSGQRAWAGVFSPEASQGMAAWENQDYQGAKKAFVEAQLKDPDDARLYYNIGAAAYAAGEYDLARDNFAQALADPALRQNSLYNLANTFYRLGDLDQAIAAYQTLLAEFPDDQEARENLEFVAARRKEAQENPGAQNPGSPDQETQNPDSKDSGNKDPQGRDPQNQAAQGQETRNQGPRDPGGKDQGGQDPAAPQGKDVQDQDARDQASPDQVAKDAGIEDSRSQERGSQGHDDPEPDTQGAMDRTETGQATARPEEAGPGGQRTAADPGKVENQAAAPRSEEAARLLEMRLNRLKDLPGKALIPAGRNQEITRDW